MAVVTDEFKDACQMLKDFAIELDNAPVEIRHESDMVQLRKHLTNTKTLLQHKPALVKDSDDDAEQNDSDAEPDADIDEVHGRRRRRGSGASWASRETDDSEDEADERLPGSSGRKKDTFNPDSSKIELPYGNLTTVEYLQETLDEIKDFHSQGQNPLPCPGLKAHINPEGYQYEMLRCIEHNAKNRAGKSTVDASPPGFGKTLAAMMAIVREVKLFSGLPSIIVTPKPVSSQWQAEFDKFFEPGTVKVLLLVDPKLPATEFVKYDVIIMSYNFLRARNSKRQKFEDTMAELKSRGDQYHEGELPQRPRLSIFADLLYWSNEVPFYYVVFDEFQLFKRADSKTNESVQRLKMLCHCSVSLSGTPVDNNWRDLFPVACLRHATPFTPDYENRFCKTFSTLDDKGQYVQPEGKRLKRLFAEFCKFVKRAPPDAQQLPEVDVAPDSFDHIADELRVSNGNYDKYCRTIKDVAKDRALHASGPTKKIRARTSRKRQSRQKASMEGWTYLFKAWQASYHPALERIMDIVKADLENANRGTEEEVQLTSKQKVEEKNWREYINKDRNWESSRVNKIVAEVNRARDMFPEVKLLVFDESIHFLDIVQAALENMYQPVKVLRYDGRASDVQRRKVLDDFEKVGGPIIMLLTRQTGGAGLNITAAWYVIICGVFWKASDEVQTWKRAHRRGQTRKVYVRLIRSSNCKVETARLKKQKAKNQHNKKIEAGFERPLGLKLKKKELE